jgi:DNA-binding NarL/FixJ family response regulator
MIAPSADLTNLLAAAIGLVHAPEAAASEVIRIGDARYRLRAEYHEAGGWIVVLMQESEGLICDDVLKTCYGLTAREIQVANLLAERLSNREIADRLDVTVSTAGRHTERVLKKLGVASRRDVRRKLLESRSVV